MIGIKIMKKHCSIVKIIFHYVNKLSTTAVLLNFDNVISLIFTSAWHYYMTEHRIKPHLQFFYENGLALFFGRHGIKNNIYPGDVWSLDGGGKLKSTCLERKIWCSCCCNFPQCFHSHKKLLLHFFRPLMFYSWSLSLTHSIIHFHSTTLHAFIA